MAKAIPLKNEILDKLEEIVDEGCHCDAMIGYQCGIHKPVHELESLLLKEINKT